MAVREYEKVRQLTKNPLLSPNEVYNKNNENRYKYYEIVKNLTEHFKSFDDNNPFFLYYKILLDGI